MALKKCKDCGKAVSTRASVCPGCGGPMKAAGVSTGMGCLIIFAVTAGLIWFGAAAINGPSGVRSASSPAPTSTDSARQRESAQRRTEAERTEKVRKDAEFRASAATVTVGVLVEYYAGNEVAADDKYKGKWFKVTGVVERVGKDILDDSYVAFESPSGSFRGVQCFFEDNRVGELGSIRPGQRLTIFGKCEGLMMNVLMKECEILNGP